MKRIGLSLALGVAATLLVMVPVLAAYYAYIYVEESAGNSYDELPVIASTNITRLAQSGFISSTGLDTRVLTGSGDALPHMLANDKVLFVTDLDAYEDKTLIFYLGATSLSSFPIIVGYNGSFETPDDPALEVGYIMELLVDGYFDASVGSNKNILYKENAFRMWISAANTLKVAAYNSTGDEQWECHYSSFTTGEHTVYLVCNGLQALLYVDNFVTAKDTANLWVDTQVQMTGATQAFSSVISNGAFYSSGRYWCFYTINSSAFGWRTSLDGDTWDAEQSVVLDTGDTFYGSYTADYRDGYVHLAYDKSKKVKYRMGATDASGNITWNATWQLVADESAHLAIASVALAVDVNGYPFITYTTSEGGAACPLCIKSSTNNGTWTTAGGYPFYLDPWNDGEASIYGYYNNDDMYIIYLNKTGGGTTLQGRYYNGSAWGSFHTIDTMSTRPYGWHAVSDDDGNLYIVWWENVGGSYYYFLRIRYADGSWGSVTQVASADAAAANERLCTISYNPVTDAEYIFCHYGSCVYAIVGDTVVGPYALSNTLINFSSSLYSDHIGIVNSNLGAGVQHQYFEYAWVPNDNSNDWYWMQNNVMPYADDFQIAINGTLQLEYKPAAIIQGTTLPDEENAHDATITWGANPAGVNATVSELQTDTSFNTTYYYQYMNQDTTDIIKPEPETMTGDVDLVRLRGNPLYPLVQVLSIGGFLNERLAWLGLAWFILIAAMFGVHLGFNARKGDERPQHFILTTITGLGFSILFYMMGIFPWWVILVMALGLIGSIIWERQPVL